MKYFFAKVIHLWWLVTFLYFTGWLRVEIFKQVMHALLWVWWLREQIKISFSICQDLLPVMFFVKLLMLNLTKFFEFLYVKGLKWAKRKSVHFLLVESELLNSHHLNLVLGLVSNQSCIKLDFFIRWYSKGCSCLELC